MSAFTVARGDKENKVNADDCKGERVVVMQTFTKLHWTFHMQLSLAPNTYHPQKKCPFP